ncbi:EpsI family protein [Geobacter metallireducens RCH3]|uniref:Exopolysaccharide synthesis membrane protein H (Exosortase) and periplasmic protein I n=1 Tax=Geobacter metallireducens (strain ATCC 53774 / DSM 7210 / GS-15) TaxID=269799 RepID=Q39VI7_GEOMG|nr:VPLPA-CTERM-specific exosortase XrtD [Geobacter metallireducens]ABB31737.1 exopolysaccharide synthesis membrane protein H (exosortase) and periplasmic protein I [Geobacter metallireducens GS-15]EHP89385.1 EpsI family protein [Geobacter metallireducens RCH3]
MRTRAVNPIFPTPASLVAVFLYGTLLTIIFSPAYRVMFRWWERDDFNHCYFVPFIVLYLVWEKRQELAALPSRVSWWGALPLVLGLALFWLGELGGEYFTLYISSWFIVVGVLWAHLGWQKLRIIGFPVLFLLTMFPPPNFIYNNLSMNLKLISSRMGVTALQLAGMSAFREGNVIDVGFTQLQVVDACSGLRYLLPLVVLGCLVAHFHRGALWQKILLVVSTIPLSIVTNGLRIASVGILYPIWGAQVAEGFFHDFSGWFIFMCTLWMLLAELWLLRKITGRPAGEGESAAGSASHRSTGIAATSVSESSVRHLPLQPVLALVLLFATAALSHGVEFREKMPIKRPFTSFPQEVGEWRGARQAMEQKFLDELTLSDYVIVNYHNPTDREINFYTAYYESQRKGESIHSPATCLPGSGWVFEESGNTQISLSGSRSMTVNRAFMQKGEVRQLTYYWFPQRGRILTSPWQLKIYAFWDALTRHRTDGALVRIITPVYPNERVDVAEERLQAFTRQIVPVLDGFLPGA